MTYCCRKSGSNDGRAVAPQLELSRYILTAPIHMLMLDALVLQTTPSFYIRVYDGSRNTCTLFSTNMCAV